MSAAQCQPTKCLLHLCWTLYERSMRHHLKISCFWPQAGIRQGVPYNTIFSTKEVIFLFSTKNRAWNSFPAKFKCGRVCTRRSEGSTAASNSIIWLSTSWMMKEETVSTSLLGQTARRRSARLGSRDNHGISQRLTQCAPLRRYVENMQQIRSVTLLAPDAWLSRNMKWNTLDMSQNNFCFTGKYCCTLKLGIGFA